jgi:hypothetical protein
MKGGLGFTSINDKNISINDMKGRPGINLDL